MDEKLKLHIFQFVFLHYCLWQTTQHFNVCGFVSNRTNRLEIEKKFAWSSSKIRYNNFFFSSFNYRFDTNKSTKGRNSLSINRQTFNVKNQFNWLPKSFFSTCLGASKLRRDLINAEIANLRDLLPLPQSTRQRLSQLQLMALVCVYVRKANYFQQGE